MISVVNLYSTKNIFSVIESRKTMWGEHIARMGRDEKCIHNFVPNLKERDHWVQSFLDVRVILTHLKGVGCWVVGSFNP